MLQFALNGEVELRWLITGCYANLPTTLVASSITMRLGGWSPIIDWQPVIPSLYHPKIEELQRAVLPLLGLICVAYQWWYRMTSCCICHQWRLHVLQSYNYTTSSSTKWGGLGHLKVVTYFISLKWLLQLQCWSLSLNFWPVYASSFNWCAAMQTSSIETACWFAVCT